MKRVITTGGTGFIGKNVERYLRNRGINIISICRSDEDINADIVLHADISRRDFVEEICCQLKMHGDLSVIQEDSAIVHMAADISMNLGEAGMTVNILGTQNVIELARKLGINRVIYISSIPVIGKPCQVPITERHPTNPVTDYHKSKLQAEKIVLSEKNIVATVLRIASPIGMGKVKKTFPDIVVSKCVNYEKVSIYGTGERVQNYIDVRDVARAVECSLHMDAAGVFLVPGFESISNTEFVKLCRKICRSDSEVEYISKEGYDSEKWIVDGSKAKKVLGYAPQIRLEESILWMLEDIR